MRQSSIRSAACGSPLRRWPKWAWWPSGNCSSSEPTRSDASRRSSARAARGVRAGRVRGEWIVRVSKVMVQRLVKTPGGSGLEKKGTRLSARRSACQWMRAMTPKLIIGTRQKARRMRRAVSGASSPLTLVSSSGPCSSSWSTRATMRSVSRTVVRMKRKR